MKLTESLEQCMTLTGDGDLISKSNRDELHKLGLIARKRGYNFLTEAGVEQLHQCGIIDRDQK